jgi:hypothetical protein
MNLHTELQQNLEEQIGEHLESPLELKQDALIARLQNGCIMEIRYASQNEYSLRWTWGEAVLGIDTAPTHKHLATFPNHFHTDDGKVLADPVTRTDARPLENIQILVTAIMRDPLLNQVQD